jgi:hypothetical protein
LSVYWCLSSFLFFLPSSWISSGGYFSHKVEVPNWYYSGTVECIKLLSLCWYF